MKSAQEIIDNAEVRLDADGNEIVDMATCGHCGRSWNNAATSSLTPTPSGRCPFEYEHEYPSDYLDGADR